MIFHILSVPRFSLLGHSLYRHHHCKSQLTTDNATFVQLGLVTEETTCFFGGKWFGAVKTTTLFNQKWQELNQFFPQWCLGPWSNNPLRGAYTIRTNQEPSWLVIHQLVAMPMIYTPEWIEIVHSKSLQKRSDRDKVSTPLNSYIDCLCFMGKIWVSHVALVVLIKPSRNAKLWTKQSKSLNWAVKYSPHESQHSISRRKARSWIIVSLCHWARQLHRCSHTLRTKVRWAWAMLLWFAMVCYGE